MAIARLGAGVRDIRHLFDRGTTVGLDDGLLLARYSTDGDPAAFEALVERHGPMVLATARGVLKRDVDVEDAFQATFLILARKASSIRGGDALGAWLHRVAYRASVEASRSDRLRRMKETEASVEGIAPASGPDHDLRAILHEEIDRLPEARRLPVVLCDLEGCTYEEAARRLRWTVPTVRTRLAKARAKLRDRLTRRGVTAIGVSLVLMPGWAEARAVVPESLIRGTLSGSASAGSAILARTLLKGMLMNQLKFATSLVVAMIALGSAGLFAHARMNGSLPVPNAARSEVVPEPEGVKTGEVVEVKGRVVGPDGNPVAGARVWAAMSELDKAEVVSGADGRFSIRVTQDPRIAMMGMDEYPWLAAIASGFGPGWVVGVCRKGFKADDVTINLIEGGRAIEGRIVDLEGRAVVDARVNFEGIYIDPKGQLADWLVKVREDRADPVWRAFPTLPLEKIETRTDADGRFELAGLGREWIAQLMVSGPTIASTECLAMSRDEPEVRAVDRMWVKPREFVIHTKPFDLVVPPSKIVAGVVRDKDSRRGIAGATIKGMVFDESSTVPAPGVEAKTDAEGRYRLAGLGKGDAYRLFIEPAPGQPYLRVSVHSPAQSPGLEPVSFDVSLKRAFIVRGRVTEKGTGKPATGHVHAYSFRGNRNLKDYPGFEDSQHGYPAGTIQADGRYETIAVPGRAILAVGGELESYRVGVGAEAIKGYNAKFKTFEATLPESLYTGMYYSLTETNLDLKAQSANVDLQVDPGRTVEVAVVDPQGKPVGGSSVLGLSTIAGHIPVTKDSPTFEVKGLDPSTPRRLTVTLAGRKLIASAMLKGDEASPLIFRLEPWATVMGRVVDDEGNPRKGIVLSTAGGTWPDNPEVNGVLVGAEWDTGLQLAADGRFRIEGLVPGLRYGADARDAKRMGGGELFRDATMKPGEVKDLGDLKVKTTH